MDSRLSPVLANLHMEKFESDALNSAQHKAKLWLRYVGDVFCIWDVSAAPLDSFLDHLNSREPQIQFTMEQEEREMLPFLDVLVQKENGHCVTTVHRKQMHTDKYLQFIPSFIGNKIGHCCTGTRGKADTRAQWPEIGGREAPFVGGFQ